MLLYVKEIQREANLYAYGVNGDEKTYELIRLICPEESDEGYGIAFYQLSDEERLALQTDAEYAITRDLYRAIYSLIENGWGKGIERIGAYMKEHNLTSKELHDRLHLKEEQSFIL